MCSFDNSALLPFSSLELIPLYIYPPIFILYVVSSILKRIEETNKQLFQGKLKSACEVYSTYTCALLRLDCMQTLSPLPTPTILLFRTHHLLSSRKDHGIINCCRGQLAVTCRCFRHLLVPGSVVALSGHGDFLISTYY